MRAACITDGSAIAQGGVRGSRVMMIEESEVKDRMKAQMDEPKVDAQTKRKKEEGCAFPIWVCCGDDPRHEAVVGLRDEGTLGLLRSVRSR